MNGKKKSARASPREYLRRYLDVTSLSLAVHRAIEAKNISRISFEPPILDVGCGFGEFAVVFFDEKADVGLDISRRELEASLKTNKYKKLVLADAREMPLQSDYFATVLSVSTLEHIEGVEEVIFEIYRVLRPGGKFIFTVNSNKINKFLYWPKVLEKRGFSKLSERYIDYYHRVFKHKSLWSKAKWRRILEHSGFRVSEVKEILSPQATAHFDKFLITAWPAQLAKSIIGRRCVWRPKWFREWAVKRYSWLVEQEESEGSNLFVVAVKKN